MKHLLLMLALLGLPALGLATASTAWAEEEPDTATEEAVEEEAIEEEAPAPAIAWAEDYESAKEQAATQKKGLFVYLTPTWFT